MRRKSGTRYVWVPGLEARLRKMKLPAKTRRPKEGCNTDCFAYDKRRVCRALRKACPIRVKVSAD